MNLNVNLFSWAAFFSGMTVTENNGNETDEADGAAWPLSRRTPSRGVATILKSGIYSFAEVDPPSWFLQFTYTASTKFPANFVILIHQD